MLFAPHVHGIQLEKSKSGTLHPMKLPFAQLPFPSPLHLSLDEIKSLNKFADVALQNALSDYEKLVDSQVEIVDVTQWKHLKKRQNIDIYQARKTATLDKMAMTSTAQDLLCYGTVKSSFNDFMYGMVTPTTEQMKLKSFYVQNHIVDCTILATIVPPTPAEPFRGVHLKWGLYGGPNLVRSVTRYRDCVYLESTGTARLCSTGELVGYHIFYSVEIPQMPQLHEHNIVRAEILFHQFFRQKADNVVEVYGKGTVDMRGEIPSKLAVFAVTETVAALINMTLITDMKKLGWLIATRKPKRYVADPEFCCVCHQSLLGVKPADVSKCYICLSAVCSKCQVKKKMGTMTSDSREVDKQTRCFCWQCVCDANQTDGWIIAVDEVSRRIQDNELEVRSRESISESDTEQP